MSFFRRKSLFILLIGIIVLVVLIGYSMSNKNQLTTPEKFLMDTVGWVQNVFHIPVQFTIDTISNIDNVKNTFNENRLLREKLAEYKTLIYEVQELEKENKELREILDITNSPRDFEPIIAHEIGRAHV